MTPVNEVYMREEMKALFALFEYSRWFPAFGAMHLLDIDLPPHQIEILRTIWYTPNSLPLCSRRTGKTFVSGGVAPVLQCLLFPGTRVGVVAPNFRTATVSFSEVENIYKKCDLVRALTVREPRHGSGVYDLVFKNGSVIEASPMGQSGDSIRGKGYNYILMDEYAYFSSPNSIVKRVIAPMLFTKRSAKTGQKPHPMGEINRLVTSCTATVAGTDYHKRVLDFAKKQENGDTDYKIVSFDFYDGLNSGIFDEKRVKQEYDDADELTRKTEYENIFVDGSSGFIGYDLLQKKSIDSEDYIDEEGNVHPPKTKIEFEGEEGKEYALIFDDGGKFDGFAVCLIKMDNGVKRLVRMKVLEKPHIDDKIRLIRDWYKEFNVVLIGCDQRNSNVLNNLDSYYEYSDGTIGECIIEKDDDQALERIQNKYGSDVKCNPCVIVHNFSAKTNELRGKTFAGDVQKGNFKIPSKLNLDSKKEVEEYKEIEKTITEIIRIQPVPKGMYIQYISPSKNFHKDRFTVCELGNYLCNEYMRDMEGRGNQEIYIGKWR